MEKLILSTAKPNEDLFIALMEELRLLKPSEQARVLNSWNPELVGGAEEVVKTLKQVVTKDWRENVSEKVPWRIEYQLLRVTAPIDHVQLLTRLFSPPDPQSIYYGREIARLDEDRFVAWVSD